MKISLKHFISPIHPSHISRILHFISLNFGRTPIFSILILKSRQIESFTLQYRVNLTSYFWFAISPLNNASLHLVDLVYFGRKSRPWIMIYNQGFLLNEAFLYETHSCIFFFMKWYKLYSLNHLFTKLNKILFITIVTIGFFLTIDNKVRIMFHCFHLHKRSRGSSMNRGTRGGD